MTKPLIGLQDLRRRICAKAKAEPSWRFWGLWGRGGPLEIVAYITDEFSIGRILDHGPLARRSRKSRRRPATWSGCR